jgi:hypothetical protein
MLENLKISKQRYPCAVKTLLDSLSEADQEILRENLCDFSIGHKTLEKALNEVGITIADTTLSRHRQGRCSCSRI